MDICLSGLPSDRILAYMDDVFIGSASFSEHLFLYKSVFAAFRKAGITLRFSNCVFVRDNVEVLGYNL